MAHVQRPVYSSGLGEYSVLLVSLIAAVLLVLTALFLASWVPLPSKFKTTAYSYGRFFYVSFLKPHTGDVSAGQQGALESFYKAQVSKNNESQVCTF